MLTTGRVADQWHTMTRTGKSPSLLEAEPRPFLEVHPDDAGGLEDGARVRVRSRRGSAVLRLRVTDAIPAGVCFAPFHWGALHLGAGRGRVEPRHLTRDRPGLQAAGAQGVRGAAGAGGRGDPRRAAAATS